MTVVKRYDTDYDDGSLIHAGPDGFYMECTACLVPADMPRELLGEAIYRAMYQHVGGDWRGVEPVEVWYTMADRLKAILSEVRPS
jgi:hypothetical protein